MGCLVSFPVKEDRRSLVLLVLSHGFCLDFTFMSPDVLVLCFGLQVNYDPSSVIIGCCVEVKG